MANILIIDDEAGLRDMFTRLLTQAGHHVTTAANGQEGLRLYRECPADIVITDIMMPERDGLETIRDLKRHHPQARIIAMTGNNAAREMGFLAYAQEFGADRGFTKPLSVRDLLAAVNELLASGT